MLIGRPWSSGSGSENTNGTFPNNGGGNTFDATISTGDPTLTTAVTVGSVTITSLGAWTVTGAGASATLSGLSSNAGTLDLFNGASVTTTVRVGLTNTGLVGVDGVSIGGSGGSSLTLGGALTNSAGAIFEIGNTGITTTSTATATSLSNAGTVYLVGNGAAQAELTLAGGLTNTGTVSVDNIGGGSGSAVTVGGNLGQ